MSEIHEQPVCQPKDAWSNGSMSKAAILLAGVALAGSLLHFWPFDTSRAWQLVIPPNAAAILWCLMLAGGCLVLRRWRMVSDHLPDVGWLAYVAVVALSVGVAPDTGRAAAVAGKLVLTGVGGYLLISHAASTERRIRILSWLLVAAVAAAVACCLLLRWATGSTRFGFFEEANKYGTYLGMLLPPGVLILLADPRAWVWLLGVLLLASGALSAGTIGALAAALAGLVAGACLCRHGALRWRILLALAVAAGVVATFWPTNFLGLVRQDAALYEADGINCRQRYIEWQAFINMMETRAVTGTGAGCVNEYRSEFYHQLPKLNTITPFDQNGWLAAAAETGILGLVCFSWAVLYCAGRACRRAWRSGRSDGDGLRVCRIALASGLIGACVGNTFSSLQYNGVLNVFVALMALAAGAGRSLMEKDDALATSH